MQQTKLLDGITQEESKSQDLQQEGEQSEISSLNQISPEQQYQLVALKAFLINNADRVKQWVDAHEKDGLKDRYPIIWDERRREFQWLNRAQRRK